MDKSCMYCLFYEQCKRSDPCEHYYPIHPDSEDEMIDEMIEEERAAFHSEWLEYICSDFYF